MEDVKGEWVITALMALRDYSNDQATGAALDVYRMREAIAAVASHTPEPPGEVVEVRGCAGVDEHGSVYGYCATGDGDDELRGQIEICGYEPTVMFTVLVPKSPPPLPTVAARVET